MVSTCHHGQIQVGEHPSYGSPYDIVVDSSGNAIVGGNHQGSFFGTSVGGKDLVVMQLNSAGVKQWSFQTGSATDDQIYSITIDSSGNIIVGGNLRSSITGHTFQGGNAENVLIKLDSGGSQVWMLSETISTSTGWEWINGVATDSSVPRLKESCGVPVPKRSQLFFTILKKKEFEQYADP